MKGLTGLHSGTQSSGLEDPSCLVLIPSEHPTHGNVPEVSLYVPFGHAIQGAPRPCLHTCATAHRQREVRALKDARGWAFVRKLPEP